MKWISGMLLGIITSLGNTAVFAQTQPLLPLGPIFQSSNSVMRNDCNLRLTNTGLLLKRFDNDPNKGFWAANDIIKAHDVTVGHPDCGGKGPILETTWTTSFVANLCTIGLAKISKGGAEKYGLYSHNEAKKRRKRMGSSGTDANGIIPGLVKENLTKLLGTGSKRPLEAYSSPEKCGVIPETSLATVYTLMSDSIFKIATDCGENKPDIPNWSARMSALLNNTSETPWVFGLQNGGTDINTEIETCQQRISESYDDLIKAAKNINILQQDAFIKNANKAYVYQTQVQLDTQKIQGTELVGLTASTMQETPQVAFCEAKS